MVQASSSDSSAKQQDEPLPGTVFDSASCNRRGFVKVEGDLSAHKLYYEVHGDGPEHVLMVMGMKNCSFSWQRQVEHFGRDPRYSILVFDNAGSGNSETPRGPYTTGGMAREAIELLDYVGWTEENEVHVVGVSMGGMIALKMAAFVPSRIASLLLGVTSAGHGIRRKLPPLDGLEITARTLFDDELERYMLMLYPQEWLDEVDEDDDQDPKRTNRETRVAEYKHRAELTPVQSLGQFFQLIAATTHHVPTSDLQTINDSIPKIVILSGSLDHLIPTDSSTNLKKHMPDAELVVWEDSGHAIHSQRPQRFNTLCERVWKEGRALAGTPKCYRTDSLLIYRKDREARQPTLIPPQFYPKGVQELIDRMWSSSSIGKDKPTQPLLNISVASPQEPEAVQLSPAEMSAGEELTSEVNSARASKKASVTFVEPEEDKSLETEHDASHHRLKNLVERLMKHTESREDSSTAGREDTPSPMHRFHNIVDQVLRRRPEEDEDVDPAKISLPPSKPPTPLSSPRKPRVELPSVEDGPGAAARSAPITPVLKLPFTWTRARSRSRDASPKGRTSTPFSLVRPSRTTLEEP